MRRGEDGFVAGSEALIFGVFIFIIGSLVFLNAWAVLDTKFAASAAAREAARAYAEANDPTTAWQQAQVAQITTLKGYRRDPLKAHMTISNSTYERCAPFTVSVEYPVDFVFIPFLSNRLTQVKVNAHYDEVVDAYRTGLSGSANC